MNPLNFTHPATQKYNFLGNKAPDTLRERIYRHKNPPSSNMSKELICNIPYYGRSIYSYSQHSRFINDIQIPYYSYTLAETEQKIAIMQEILKNQYSQS